MKQPVRGAHAKPASKTKRKSREELNEAARDRKRDKKHRGNASGSRANPVASAGKSGQGNKAKDPRIGSKKPIPLVADGATASAPVKAVKKAPKPAAEKVRLSPEEELAQLENSERLDALLDRMENGDTLSAEEQAWLDETLDRIDELMEQLGIDMDDEAEDEQAEEDMYRLLKGN